MQAKDFYEIGKKAYNGDEDAGRSFFELMASVVEPIASVYGLLPSYVMAKLVIESGWMTDLWNATAERLTGKTFQKKAQDHNNVFGMNCFDDNQKYLERLPLPAWTNYRTTFNDWGPHGFGDSFHVKWERWKSYRTVEDAVEDWCANIRYQAEAHGHHWNPTDITAQLLATESYTPEGSAEGVREGLHFQWQEKIMIFYEHYDLKKYDEEVKTKVENVKMTTANLDAHIKKAYDFAHASCQYGRTDTHFPPGETGWIDCVGLVYRALYTMGYFDRMLNIDQLHALAESLGLKKSVDINDVWKRHGIVCMQDCHLKGTIHISHVYYSLGGSGVGSISKYDLGSNERIQANQPFSGVPVNEWEGKRNFLCIYCVEEKTLREDVPAFRVASDTAGKVILKAGFYTGPGTMWRKIGLVKPGDKVTLRGTVRNDTGNLWVYVRYKNTDGYIPNKAVVEDSFTQYTGIVTGTDGRLAVRAGAGVECFKVADVKEGVRLRVDNRAVAKDGSEWLHILSGKKIRGFVSAQFIKKATTKG